MSELNAEQIKKALECCTSGSSVSACMSGCPLYEKEDCECVNDDTALLKYALALIKELTEENERLRTENEFLLNIKNLNIDKVQADTVRKMAERLKQTICDNTYPDFNKAGKPVNIWKSTTGYDLIDQIAKEIINESTAT